MSSGHRRRLSADVNSMGLSTNLLVKNVSFDASRPLVAEPAAAAAKGA